LLDDNLLSGHSSLAIYFKIDHNILVSRLVNRRTCSGCGEIYNLISSPPAELDKCDKCGNALFQREDDNEKSLVNRLSVFSKNISEITKFYEETNRLQVIDVTNESSLEVFEKINYILSKYRS